MRIDAIQVVRVSWIPYDVHMVLDRPVGERPILWVRKDVPEAIVQRQLAAALGRRQ